MGMFEAVAILFFTEEERQNDVANDAISSLVDTEGLFSGQFATAWKFQDDRKKWKVLVSREVDSVR